jgi:hypothetical protein
MGHSRSWVLLPLFGVALGCGSASTEAPAHPVEPPPPSRAVVHAIATPPAIDLDGDGLTDIVVESLGSQGAGVYLGGASPRLASFVLGGTDVAGSYGRDAMGVGDLDHDGSGDIAVVDELYHHVVVYLAREGGVSAPQVLTIPDDGAPIANVAASAAGDVNEDGFADLVVGSTGAIYLFFGDAGGLTTPPVRIPGPDTYGASVAGGADVNGDGHTDVVVGTSLEHAIFLHLGDGHTLGTATRLDGGGQQMGDDIAMAGDVNHDGFADVITSGYGGNGGWIFYGSRSGLGAPTSLGASGDAGWSLWVSAAGDVDHDGFDDVVAGGYASDGAFLYRGSATGLASEPQRLAPIHPDVPWMYRVRGVGDVDGDGFDDVVVDNTMAPRFLYRGRATGLSPVPERLDSRPDPTAPVPVPPPPPVTFPPAETTCAIDADCERASKLDDRCCPLCAQYVAATHAWVARVEAICAARGGGGCAISCAEGPPPTAHCESGHCVLRPHP